MRKRGDLVVAKAAGGISLLIRTAAALALPLALTACVVAPGMDMIAPATVPVSISGTGGTEDINVPIHEIDINLIREQQAARASNEHPNVRKLIASPRAYVIGPGDVLQITVWDHPELAAAAGMQASTTKPSDAAAGFIVDQHGNIQFPFVGALHVSDLSPEDAQIRLVKQLSKSYIDPQVTLRVASFRAKSVYIDGEVKTPGLQAFNDIPMTLLEVVNRAGGFTADADQGHMTLLRDGTSYPIDLTTLVDRGINPAGIVLQPGDLLRVSGREDNGVFVMGEVNKPSLVLPMKTGRLTLSQALAQAGSINSNTANAKALYVIRGAASGSPQVYHMNAHSPVAMTLANDFQLLPNDVVYVDGNGLVRFSRVLSLLLPSVNTGMSAAVMAR
jgi:polysaccharide export outer membrane protein